MRSKRESPGEQESLSERERLKEGLFRVMCQAQPLDTRDDTVASLARYAQRSQFRTTALVIVCISLLFGLYILVANIYRDGLNRPARESAAMQQVDKVAAYSGGENLRQWKSGLVSLWEGRKEIRFGYGQGLDHKQYVVDVRQIVRDKQNRVYLYGTRTDTGKPGHFRLDKITEIHTPDGILGKTITDEATREAVLLTAF